MQSQRTTSGESKKTNSLAFARTDCHTCASLGERCDCRRPRCSSCLDRGRKCEGFTTPLSWDPRRMWSGNPSTAIGDAFNNLTKRGNTAVDTFTSHSAPMFTGKTCSQRPFRFVKGPSRPRKRRKAGLSREKFATESQAGGQECLSVAVSNAVPRVDSNLVSQELIGNGLGERGMAYSMLYKLSILRRLLSNLVIRRTRCKLLGRFQLFWPDKPQHSWVFSFV